MIPIKSSVKKDNFYLDKWFLDFVSEDGEAMIFYVANLHLSGWEIPYTSWLHYMPSSGAKEISRFRNIQIPEINNDVLSFEDRTFGVKGQWVSGIDSIQSRLFDSSSGYLDWNCHQPLSEVTLELEGRSIKGKGYAEQLILTVPPWKMPLDELRWGRFGSEKNYLVWIEIREKENAQWLWLNGEKKENVLIKDDRIALTDEGFELKLDQEVVLESEKKIYSVIEKITSYLPGINKLIPLNILMAHEQKWLSKGVLLKDGVVIDNGSSIHEYVNFKGSRL